MGSISMDAEMFEWCIMLWLTAASGWEGCSIESLKSSSALDASSLQTLISLLSDSLSSMNAKTEHSVLEADPEVINSIQWYFTNKLA